MALGETLIYVSNNRGLPAHPAGRGVRRGVGRVVDIFLPRWISERIPPISGGVLLIGLGANLLALRRRVT